MLYVCLYAADICTCLCWVWASQLVVAVKNSPTNAGGLGSIPGSYVEKYIQYIQCLMLCVHFKSMRLTFYSMQY